MIYAYEFSDNSVYVGLTCNPVSRQNDHLISKRKEKSSVYKHFIKTNLYPKFIELTTYLNNNIAILKEEEFLNLYKNKGWTILNKIKTGGLGSSIRKWNINTCTNDALKYNTKKEWRKNSKSAYFTASKNKWLDECTKHMIPLIHNSGYWTFTNCLNDALKYKTKKEWRFNSISAYGIAHKNNWLHECTKHMIKTKNNFWKNKLI